MDLRIMHNHHRLEVNEMAHCRHNCTFVFSDTDSLGLLHICGRWGIRRIRDGIVKTGSKLLGTEFSPISTNYLQYDYHD